MAVSPSQPESPHLSVIVPAYNEETRIRESLRQMIEYFDGQGYSYELIVVDDGSTDSTIPVVREVAGERPNVKLAHYDGNRGKGHAVRFGILQAVGDFVLFSDADLATPIDEVESLFKRIGEGYDIAIASRDIPGAKLERRQSRFREMGGKLFNRCVQLVAVPGIHDTQCGFKLFTRAAAQNVFSRCRIDNFSFDVEVLYLARLLGYRVAEVPVRWHHVDGSKVRFARDAVRMLRTLLQIKSTDYGIPTANARRTSAP